MSKVFVGVLEEIEIDEIEAVQILGAGQVGGGGFDHSARLSG